jgi:hypothetical protein
VTIHVLVEGASERALLECWAPRLLGNGIVRVHSHQGKGELPRDPTAAPDKRRRGLLDQLPAKLRGFANALHSNIHHVVVLVDADKDEPKELAARISKIATQIAPGLSVTIRLAVEETEAFYLGDLKGMKLAFPDADMDQARAYIPDSIIDTWELFGTIVQDGGGNKVAWAEAMGPVLTTTASRSRSPSFQDLVRALFGLTEKETPAEAARKGRHRHLSQKKRNASRGR